MPSRGGGVKRYQEGERLKRTELHSVWIRVRVVRDQAGNYSAKIVVHM